jgi:sarcosine oxidase
MKRHYEIIVIGLGAMGSATIYQLAKCHQSVLGIDQLNPPHNFGASGGHTRIYRQATAQGAEYVPLTLRTLEIWKDIEKQTRRHLFSESGMLIIANSIDLTNPESFLAKTFSIANQFNIPHQILDPNEINKKFPQFKVDKHNIAYLEKQSGFAYSSECIGVQLELAKHYGAVIKIKEKVLEIDNKSSHIQVVTNRGKYECNKVVLCVGPWMINFMGTECPALFKISDQIFFWFDIKNYYQDFMPAKCPAFIWNFALNKNIYGFPAVDGADGGIKLTTERKNISSEEIPTTRVACKNEINNIFNKFVAPYFAKVSSKCIKTLPSRCIITPDYNFIIDYHPTDNRILLVSACSGHGFKDSAAVGEICSDLITTGKSRFDINKFKLQRF